MRHAAQELRRRGFTYDRKSSDGQRVKLFVRFERRGNSIVGNARLVGPGLQLRIEASVDMTEAQIEAMTMLLPKLRNQALRRVSGLDDYIGAEDDFVGCPGDDEVVGRRRRRRKKKKQTKFRRWIHKMAKRFAKAKVLKKLRAVRVKLVKSPLGDIGIKAAAGALNAYGVPRSVTTMVLNQARATTVDRLQKGGWAGQLARSTRKGARRGDFWREEGLRHAKALPGSIMSGIPGGKQGAKALGGLLGSLGGKGKGKGKTGKALQGLLGGLMGGADKPGVAPPSDPADGGDIRQQLGQAGMKEGMKALGGLLGNVGAERVCDEIGNCPPGHYHGAVGYGGAYQRGWYGY